MKIVFNAHRVGFGNNGGSRTIIKCAEALAALGTDVVLFGVNKYTWHKPHGVKFHSGDQCPPCDVVVATGYRSVKNTLTAKTSKKFYYVRGYELWQANKTKLIESYKSLRCIVNSRWLHNFMAESKIHSDIVYQGVDLDKFHNTGGDRDGMGAIYHEKHKTKRHQDAIAVAKILRCKLELLNRDIINPSEKKLNRWYNHRKVWFAPTELEGLHNPPMEAALAGCALVCTDHPMSGMHDYATNETAMVYPARDLEAAADCVKKLLVDSELHTKLSGRLAKLVGDKIGSRSKNARRLLSIFNE